MGGFFVVCVGVRVFGRRGFSVSVFVRMFETRTLRVCL